MKIIACETQLQGGQFRPARGGQLHRLLQRTTSRHIFPQATGRRATSRRKNGGDEVGYQQAYISII